ncbi:hypothetical protein BGZ74_005359 [Mortierella antarctica]|nr:hypothetical protein BGZ74_005359 [Mortierella antarctica]
MLDITILGQTGIMHVQKIFSHCCLEKLAIKCDPIDINMLHIIAKLIKFVQWPLLGLLRLSGNNINQWIQLLAKIDTPRLKAIKISGTKSVQQELSHENTLFIVRLIGTSTLRELFFEDVLLQDQRDWALLVEKMDPAMLENFYLGKGSYEQFLASRDAPDLDNSKWTQWDEEQRVALLRNENKTNT